MNERIESCSEYARALFKDGYNCAQSVLGAFCDELGIDFETAIKLSSSFGGGMGRLREVCGAVTGMFMVAGLMYGYTDPLNDTEKAEHYKLIQFLAEEFKKENGSIICRELLGLDKEDNPIPEKRTKEYYEKRPCADFIEQGAIILEELIKNKTAEGIK